MSIITQCPLQQAFHNQLINSVPIVKKNDGTIKPENTISNCFYILENEPFLKDRIMFNELSNNIEIVKPMPWHDQTNFKVIPFTDIDDAYLRMYFEQYDMKYVKAHLEDAVTTIADSKKYHPVKEYFKALEWDGIQRIDTLLHDLLKTESNIYYSEVIKIFLIGAVARIYNAGCQFDYMMIISGEQGIRKSTFFKVLAVKPEWYLGDLRSFDKAGCEQLQGKWIAECGELSAMKRAKDVENIKAFITNTTDNYRVPYGKRPSDFPRQCVFGGTTNEDIFLHDKTGNRRFLPVKANISLGETIDTDYLATIVDQLWAEAIVLYNQGYVPMLSKEAQRIAYGLQNEALDEDFYFGLIQNYLQLDGWGTRKAPTAVCIKMLWDNAIDGRREIRSDDKKEITRIMNKMPNWKVYDGSKDGRKEVAGYGYQKCWVKINS
jgi:predicted P-loop ATPase